MSDELVKRLRGQIKEAAQAYTDDWFNNPGTKRPQHSIPAQDGDTDLVLAKGIKEAANRIEALEAALRDVVGMLDDPTGGEHVRDMRGATIIARAALQGKARQ